MRSNIGEDEKLRAMSGLHKGTGGYEYTVCTRNVVLVESLDVRDATGGDATGGDSCRVMPIAYTSTVAVARPSASVNRACAMFVSVRKGGTFFDIDYDESERKRWVKLHKDYTKALRGELTKLSKTSEIGWAPVRLKSAVVMPETVARLFGTVARDFLRVGALCSATRALQDFRSVAPVHVGFERTVAWRHKAPRSWNIGQQSVVTAKTAITASSLVGNLFNRGQDTDASLSFEVSMCGCRHTPAKRCPVHKLSDKRVSIGAQHVCSGTFHCGLVSRCGRDVVRTTSVTELVAQHDGLTECLKELLGLCSLELASVPGDGAAVGSSEVLSAEDARAAVDAVESKLDAAEAARKRQKRACSEASDLSVAELVRKGGFVVRETDRRTTFFSLGTCVPALNPTYALYAEKDTGRKRKR